MIPVRAVLSASLACASASQAQLVVSSQWNSGASPATWVKPYLKIKNTGAAAVDMSRTSIDYLVFETGVQAKAIASECFWESLTSCADVVFDVAPIPLQEDGVRRANIRFRIGFASGILGAGQEMTIQWGFRSQGYVHSFEESDDWSFNGSDGAWTPSARIPVWDPSTPPPTTLPLSWGGVVEQFPVNRQPGNVVRHTAYGASYVRYPTGWVVIAKDRSGAKGAKGPVGDVGAKGVAGLAGPSGPSGVTGLQGPVGMVGMTGPKGQRGQPGADGASASTAVLDAKLATLKATTDEIKILLTEVP